MSASALFKAIGTYNVRTLRASATAELSGSLGDIGTFLPLMIAMALNGSVDIASTLIFSGLANIITGLIFGVPLPVQPMKAIAAIAISRKFTIEETMAAGLTMAFAVLTLSATRLISVLNWIVPLPVVKGIQVGAGLSLTISAGSQLIATLTWIEPGWDNRVIAVVAFVCFALVYPIPRVPYALAVVLIGLAIAAANGPGDWHKTLDTGFWHPRLVIPEAKDWRIGAIEAALPQLPLTLLNSVIAVSSLAKVLFPQFPPPPSCTALGFSVGLANFIGCWFGAMPICHGSGGLAGQYRFGARSGTSIVILGLIKCLVGIFVGERVIPLLQRFPKSLLGVMVIAAGVELARAGWTRTDDQSHRLQAEPRAEDEDHFSISREVDIAHEGTTMLVTASGCLAFKNDSVGFLAGLIWYWIMKWPHFARSLRPQEACDERESLLGAQPGSDERINGGVSV